MTARKRCAIAGCRGSSAAPRMLACHSYLCQRHYRLIPRAEKAARRALWARQRAIARGVVYPSQLAAWRAWLALRQQATCMWLAWVRDAQIAEAMELMRECR